jgi:hypothetical protein
LILPFEKGGLGGIFETARCPQCLVKEIPYTLLLSHLSQEIGILTGSFPFLGYIRRVGIGKREGFCTAEVHALGISIAVITLHSDPVLDIEEGMAERTGNDASPASDAQVFIDDYPVIEFGFSVAGLCRAYLNAIGAFTVITEHGKVDSGSLPFDYPDPGTARITCSRVIYRAYQLTQATPRALLLINDQYFFEH